MPQEKPQNIEDFLTPKHDTIELALPSGLVVTFRCPPLAFHIGLNSVPGRVANAVAAVRRKEISLEEAERIEPDTEEIERRAEAACVYCLVKPRFRFNPGPDEYDVRRMQPLDKLRVYNWAMRSGGGGVDLETFRKESAGEVPPAGKGGKAKRKAAQPVPEKSGVGVGS